MMTANIFRSPNVNWKKRNVKPLKDYKKIYYIFAEGKTELVYFKGIRDFSKSIGISDELMINPVDKTESGSNESDAARLKNAILSFQKKT